MQKWTFGFIQIWSGPGWRAHSWTLSFQLDVISNQRGSNWKSSFQAFQALLLERESLNDSRRVGVRGLSSDAPPLLQNLCFHFLRLHTLFSAKAAVATRPPVRKLLSASTPALDWTTRRRRDIHDLKQRISECSRLCQRRAAAAMSPSWPPRSSTSPSLVCSPLLPFCLVNSH